MNLRTGCECSGPGWCPRHGVFKPKRWFELCQSRHDYWTAWEQGRGPGQHATANGAQANDAHMLGDRLHHWLRARGITEEWYREVKSQFGLPPTCNCQKRREWLNHVGEWLKARGVKF